MCIVSVQDDLSSHPHDVTHLEDVEEQQEQQQQEPAPV